MTQLSNGSIVSLSHDGKPRLALIEHIPKNKASMVRIVLDPGRKGGYEAIPIARALLTVIPESTSTQAARLRIKAKRDSGGGLAEINRRTRADSRQMYDGDQGGTGGFGSPERRAEPMRLAIWGTSYWTGGLERHICGSMTDWIISQMRSQWPRYWQVLELHEDLGLSLEQIAERFGITRNNAYQIRFRARAKYQELKTAYLQSTDEKRPDPEKWVA